MMMATRFRQFIGGCALFSVCAYFLVACSLLPVQPGAPEESQGEQSFEEWALAYAGCMREQGIDIPDPEVGAEGDSVTFTFGAENGEAAYSAADKHCNEVVGLPPGSTLVNQEESDSSMLEMAQCLREKGYDVADPEPNGGITFPEEISEDVLKECGLSLNLTEVPAK